MLQHYFFSCYTCTDSIEKLKTIRFIPDHYVTHQSEGIAVSALQDVKRFDIKFAILICSIFSWLHKKSHNYCMRNFIKYFHLKTKIKIRFCLLKIKIRFCLQMYSPFSMPKMLQFRRETIGHIIVCVCARVSSGMRVCLCTWIQLISGPVKMELLKYKEHFTFN